MILNNFVHDKYLFLQGRSLFLSFNYCTSHLAEWFRLMHDKAIKISALLFAKKSHLRWPFPSVVRFYVECMTRTQKYDSLIIR